MAGKQAKVLSAHQLKLCLDHVAQGRHSTRNTVIILLSAKAGLRAGEIAALTWAMVNDPRGRVGNTIELEDRAAKKGSGRIIPIHSDLRASLLELKKLGNGDGAIITSERGGAMTAGAVVNWFSNLYQHLGFAGCSSHSGRRTFITNAARRVHRAGGSLRDVQELAGHRSITMTQRYIDGDSESKRRLVQLL